MSVLNQSGEEQQECPLCMEPLEVDDLNFYPCTCGYQICRFCWHRIRTDENGLCPACRKAYSENPADFIPLSQEQVAKLKAEKRQRDQQKKAKLSESRKHLASVRVVQRNLVFVVGLPVRLADAEILRRHEYFGKFGKIHKVVINQSTSYAGSQGPSASAYVTYMKSDDALRAIQSVNNITIDGRQIKSSLGTTKYCSHFMKNQPCPKADCMYLHDFGDPEASFTKEQMHAGKHQEYEKKLHEALVARTQNNTINGGGGTTAPVADKGGVEAKTTVNTVVGTSKGSSKEIITNNINVTINIGGTTTTNSSSSSSSNNGTNKENWPQLNIEKEKKEKEKTTKKTKTKTTDKSKDKKDVANNVKIVVDNKVDKLNKLEDKDTISKSPTQDSDHSTSPDIPSTPPQQTTACNKLPSQLLDDNSSFFSLNPFQKILPDHSHLQQTTVGGGTSVLDGDVHSSVLGENPEEDSTAAEHPSSILTDVLPGISTTEDWAAAFGFSRHSNDLTAGVEDLTAKSRESFGSNGYTTPLVHDNGFSKGMDLAYNGFLMDMLNKSNSFGYKPDLPQAPQQQPQLQNGLNGINGLDQNMSKFFMDFHKNNKDLGNPGFPPINGMPNSYYQAERIMLLQQKQLEEQFINLSMNKSFGGANTSSGYQNGSSHYMNGDQNQFGMHGSQLFGNTGGMNKQQQQQQQHNRNIEDELDFDPIQETQKAFAELMASEQNHKTQSANANRSQVNGVVHGQNGGYLPPPPPGFMQPSNTHMNSFGSKILPFLNMSNNSSQIPNSSTQQNNWPSNFNSQPQQQTQHHKNVTNTCNDWKVLDPAILSSSRHYPLAANMPPLRDHYSIQQLGAQQIQQNGLSSPQIRNYDFANSAFSNFTQQLQQPSYNGYSQHINGQQNLNWFNSEINTNISSPPGFRNQTTKQQEC